MQNKFSVQLQMAGHRTDGNHGPGSNPSKLRTPATKKSSCWRNQAITLTENLAIRSHLMSLAIASESRGTRKSVLSQHPNCTSKTQLSNDGDSDAIDLKVGPEIRIGTASYWTRFFGQRQREGLFVSDAQPNIQRFKAGR